MATEKWIAGSGQGLTWGSAFGTEINGLANGNAILSSVSITNGTPLDIFADVSFLSGSASTTASPGYFGIYLYPLGEDGATYGDGRFASAAAGPPAGQNSRGNIIIPTPASGTTIMAGVLERIIIPPGTFSFVLYNQCGTTTVASNTCKYRTYNRSVA